MIRALNKRDHKKLMELIQEEPEYNLYSLGDIENYGYDKDFIEYFGEFDEAGVIHAVLVRYFGIFNIYAKDSLDINGFVNLIKGYDDLYMLSGKANIASKFEDTDLGFNQSEFHHFAVLKELNNEFAVDKKIIVKKTRIEDVERIAELKGQISEFSSENKNFKKILRNEFKAGTAQGYYVEVAGKMVSYVQTSAENSKSAMVVSVMTAENYRKKGLASGCLKVLCEDLVSQGKTLCLFYKNPEAGAIYRRLGFEDIGFWSMYMKK